MWCCAVLFDLLAIGKKLVKLFTIEKLGESHPGSTLGYILFVLDESDSIQNTKTYIAYAFNDSLVASGNFTFRNSLRLKQRYTQLKIVFVVVLNTHSLNTFLI